MKLNLRILKILPSEVYLFLSLLVHVSNQAPSEISSYSCPESFNWLQGTQNCYFISDPFDRKDFVEAENECATKKSTLVVINNAKERDMILSLMTPLTPYWIGMVEQASGNARTRAWSWIDGSTFNENNDLLNWEPNEPNNFENNTEKCVQARKANDTYGALNDETCFNKWPYICELHDSKSVNPTEWKCLADNCCYTSLTSLNTFSEAKAQCNIANSSSHLPVFSNSTNWSNFLEYRHSLLDHEIVWLGYSDLGKENQWLTYDEGISHFFNWSSTEPNNWQGFEDCMIVGWNDTDEWFDDSCITKRKTVCQICLEPQEPKTTPSICPVNTNSSDVTITTLAILLVIFILSTIVLLWVHLRRNETFKRLEDSVADKLRIRLGDLKRFDNQPGE